MIELLWTDKNNCMDPSGLHSSSPQAVEIQCKSTTLWFPQLRCDQRSSNTSAKCAKCVCVPCLRLGHVHTNPANNLQTIFQTVVGLGLSSSLEALHDFLLLFLPISLLPVTGSAFANAGNKSLPAHNRARSWDRMNKAWGIWKCMLETHPLLSKGKGIDSIDGPCSFRSFFPLLRLWLLPAQRTFTGCCPRDHVHSICFKLFQSFPTGGC